MTMAHRGVALAGSHRDGHLHAQALGQRTVSWGCSWACLEVFWQERRKQEWEWHGNSEAASLLAEPGPCWRPCDALTEAAGGAAEAHLSRLGFSSISSTTLGSLFIPRLVSPPFLKTRMSCRQGISKTLGLQGCLSEVQFCVLIAITTGIIIKVGIIHEKKV